MKGPSLRVIFMVLRLPLLVALADWAWTQAPSFKYKSEGVFAYYRIQDSFREEMGSGVVIYGNRQAYVEISEGAEALASGGTSTTVYQLNFEVSVSTPTGYGYAYGSGRIPTDSVTFEKPVNHNLTLKVNTGLLPPPFYKNQYGTITVPFPNIDLRWTRSANDWYRWEGHQIREIGQSLVAHSQGSGVRYFAIPEGTVTLPEVPLTLRSTYMDGWLGSEKASTSLIQRGPKK